MVKVAEPFELQSKDAWAWAPAGYATRCSQGAWTQSEHHLAISEAVTQTISTGGKLLISAPPRHGKSELISHWLPVAYLDIFPDRKVIMATYEQTFASEWGFKVKESIVANRTRLRVRIYRGSQAAAHVWQTEEGGGMFCAGVGGPMTGRGAHLLVIDDPIKNWAEANSPTFRHKTWQWYLSVAATRLEPGACEIVGMTRWHQNDFAASLLEQGGWTHLRLPAIADSPDDPLSRKLGEPLWPSRWPLESLEKIRARSEHVWQGMYQQNPVAPKGQIVDGMWWRYWIPADKWSTHYELEGNCEPLPAHFSRHTNSWDMTFKWTADGSFLVGQSFGHLSGKDYLLDQDRSRCDYPEARQRVIGLQENHPADVTLVENTGNGPQIIADLKGAIPGLKAVNPKDSKHARVQASAHRIQAGKIILPHPDFHPWVLDYIDEFSAFPSGTNDDQVDATTQMIANELTVHPATTSRISLGR